MLFVCIYKHKSLIQVVSKKLQNYKYFVNSLFQSIYPQIYFKYKFDHSYAGFLQALS